MYGLAKFSEAAKKMCSPDRNGSFADKKVRRARASRHRLKCQMTLPMVWSGIFICYLERVIFVVWLKSTKKCLYLYLLRNLQHFSRLVVEKYNSV